jgi:hypothetical protein
MPDNTLPHVAAVEKSLTLLRQEDPAVAAAFLEERRKADPTSYEKYVFEKRTGRPAPTEDTTVAQPTYHDIVKAVEMRAQLDESSLDDAWVWLLKAHPEWSPHYRRWQLSANGRMPWPRLRSRPPPSCRSRMSRSGRS